MLLGSSGARSEDLDYIQNLVINIVKFISFHLKNKVGIVCQTADTLFSHITIKLAQHYKIKIFIINPCLYYERDEGGEGSARGRLCHALGGVMASGQINVHTTFTVEFRTLSRQARSPPLRRRSSPMSSNVTLYCLLLYPHVCLNLCVGLSIARSC